MKAILAYGPDSGGPFTDWGLIRPLAGRSYVVEAIPASDRAGTNEPSGYQVTLNARALTIRQSFFDFDNYFWRITYPETGQIILVGDYPYIFSFDGRHEQNKIFHYNITVSFVTINANLLSVIISNPFLP